MLLAGRGSVRTGQDDSNDDSRCSACGMVRDVHRTWVQDETFSEDVDLLRFLPTSIDHSQSSSEFGSAYNIISRLDSLSLSAPPKYLSVSERRHVDFQVGRLVQRLSYLRSPLGKFGPAVSVLCPTAVTQSRAGGGMDSPGGIGSWRVAFHSILSARQRT